MSSLASAAGNPWQAWERLSRTRCPSHHVNWMANNSYQFLVENFDATLSAPMKGKVDRLADTDRRCANVWGGLRCEANRNFVAYEKLGLMTRFADYACLRIKCEEAAICSRAPTG